MVTAPPARWWHRKDEQIVCDLCPRECSLHEGQRGFCFVRQNVGGEMTLTTYGRSTGFCIDPIEKKPLNHFLPGTPVLSFGTAGCNLGCKFCQNWSISKSREIELLSDEASPEAIAQAALKSGCRSVAFTYNDPVIWAEYAMDTARACRAVGLKTVAVTAGYITPEARPAFYAEMDAANVDLKGFTEEFYKFTTLSHLEPVLDTLKWLKHESDVWFEITNLMIPGENDSEDETARMCDWIVENLGPDVPLHFTAFHPDFRMRDTPPTPPQTLLRARELAMQAGIHFPYVGNVHHQDGQSTVCPTCHDVLIERNWYQLGRWKMDGNRCSTCGTVIPGVFEKRPGDWGPRRQPVRISPPVVPLNLGPSKQETASPSTPIEAKRDVKPAPGPAIMTTAAPVRTPRTDFTDSEVLTLLAHTRKLAEAVLKNTERPVLPDELHAAEAYGLFVTFKRSGDLRGCRGRFGTIQPLGDLLAGVVEDTVLDDPRFPAISADELHCLDVDLSVMYGPEDVTVSPDRRAEAIVVGRHGVVLSHPRGRGLLLPQVATAAGWYSLQFLQAVSEKAGLSREAWKSPDSRLMTFQARVLEDHAPGRELNWDELTPADFDRLREIVEAVASRGPQSAAGISPALNEPSLTECGLAMRLPGGQFAVSMAADQSLAQMAASLGSSLMGAPEVRRINEVTVFGHPVHLRAVDYPSRHGHLSRAAVIARNGSQWTLQFPDGQPGSNPIAAALAGLKVTAQEWRSNPAIKVTAYTSLRSESVMPGEDRIRPAARAGQFYPASPQEIREDIERYLSEVPAEPKERRAVMLPHAGWVYCGSVIGRTLARTAVPKTVIILSPKHTPHGPHWSVSSADTWAYPGAEVPVAKDLRARLLKLVPGLAAEADAHRAEHGVEVLVPFLHAKQPDLRILPIVMGATSYAQTERMARGLASLLADADEPILLVISSDMNHFAPEAENRRRDLLAVEAFCTGDAGRLFDVVQQNDISMCGVIPAVTVLRTLHDTGALPRPELVHYGNSAAVSGDFQRVVGYAGCLV